MWDDQVRDPCIGASTVAFHVLTLPLVFTLPSSVDVGNRETQSGNVCLHSMIRVTKASLAYIATQARFGLHSANTFSCTNSVVDSETFYRTILDLLEDPEEKEEVDTLLAWWNR
ncbi:hypothetical protein OF83DRAFT_1062214 [Amylostereum chailletii]|nr:hypothetical protein OF83DRAFT_1062214 [Amylostereum chailletii]